MAKSILWAKPWISVQKLANCVCICCVTSVCIIVTLVLWPALYLNVLCNRNAKCFRTGFRNYVFQGSFCICVFISRLIQKVVNEFWLNFSRVVGCVTSISRLIFVGDPDVDADTAIFTIMNILCSKLKDFNEFLQYLWVLGCLTINVHSILVLIRIQIHDFLRKILASWQFCAVRVLLINDVLVKL